MQNNEKPALYTDPQLALEVMRKLKAACPEPFWDLLLQTIDGLTGRDLLFYSLGKLEGICAAEAVFASTLGSSQAFEKESNQWKISIDMLSVEPRDAWTVLSIAMPDAIGSPLQGFRYLIVRYRDKQTAQIKASQIERAVKCAAIEVEEA